MAFTHLPGSGSPERECDACAWKGLIDETLELGCPRCHAPTRAGKNLAAAALGRLGGLKGGRARADILTPARRRQIARKAARARWSKAKN